MSRRRGVGFTWVVAAIVSWQVPAQALDCSRQYFLYGREGLFLGDRATIGYGLLGASNNVELGAAAGIQGSVVANFLTLRSNARLNGTAFTNNSVNMQAGAKIFGATLPISSTLLCSTPAIPSFTAAGPDIFVEGTLRLPPGQYGHLYVTPDSTLTVESGAYYFEAVVFEPDSSLIGLWRGAPAELFVQDGVMFGDRHSQRVLKAANTTSTRSAVVLYSLQQSQLRLGTDSTIVTQVIAPNAEVNVPSRTSVKAPLYGRVVRIEPDASVGNPFNNQPNACQ